MNSKTMDMDMNMDNEMIKIKIGIFGESHVGKTTLVHSFMKKKIKKSYSTDHPELFNLNVTLTVEGEELYINAKIFDTPGQERYSAIVSQYFEGLDAIIIVYDVSNVGSFEKIETWVNKIKEQLDDSKLIIYLVGNKIDLERRISNGEGAKKANEYNYEFQETSAKEGINVQELFESLLTKVYFKTQNIHKIKSGKKRTYCFGCL